MIMTLAKAFKRIGKDKRGFTIVELMAVFAVLAVIAAIAVPRFTGTVEAAKLKTDKASAQIIAKAAEQKWIDDGESTGKTYTGTELATAGYLQKAPEPQKDGFKGYKATVASTGIIDKVVYIKNDDSDDTANLLQ